MKTKFLKNVNMQSFAVKMIRFPYILQHFEVVLFKEFQP